MSQPTLPENAKDIVLSTYTAILVPEDGPPVHAESKELDGLLREVYGLMMKHRRGHLYVHANGQLCKISVPRQVFMLKLPVGEPLTIQDPTAFVFQEDYRFSVLVQHADPSLT